MTWNEFVSLLEWMWGGMKDPKPDVKPLPVYCPDCGELLEWETVKRSGKFDTQTGDIVKYKETLGCRNSRCPNGITYSKRTVVCSPEREDEIPSEDIDDLGSHDTVFH